MPPSRKWLEKWVTSKQREKGLNKVRRRFSNMVAKISISNTEFLGFV
jgi:hypothetical protein